MVFRPNDIAYLYSVANRRQTHKTDFFPKIKKRFCRRIHYMHRFHNILRHRNNKCDKTLRGIMVKKNS